jgi:hypothetical protein
MARWKAASPSALAMAMWHKHGTRFLAGDAHVDHAVLEHLKAADGPPELFAGAQVFERKVAHRFHRSDRLGELHAQRAGDCSLDQRERAALGAEGLGRCAVERQACVAVAVNGAETLDRKPGRVGGKKEQRDAIVISAHPCRRCGRGR